MQPAGRNSFLPIQNLSQALAGQVSMMLFPAIRSDCRKIIVISCTGSKYSVPAVEATWDMSLKTGLRQQGNVTASMLFLSVSRKKKQERKKE